jgi:hypothetical protein
MSVLVPKAPFACATLAANCEASASAIEAASGFSLNLPWLVLFTSFPFKESYKNHQSILRTAGLFVSRLTTI